MGKSTQVGESSEIHNRPPFLESVHRWLTPASQVMALVTHDRNLGVNSTHIENLSNPPKKRVRFVVRSTSSKVNDTDGSSLTNKSPEKLSPKTPPSPNPATPSPKEKSDTRGVKRKDPPTSDDLPKPVDKKVKVASKIENEVAIAVKLKHFADKAEEEKEKIKLYFQAGFKYLHAAHLAESENKASVEYDLLKKGAVAMIEYALGRSTALHTDYVPVGIICLYFCFARMSLLRSDHVRGLYASIEKHNFAVTPQERGNDAKEFFKEIACVLDYLRYQKKLKTVTLNHPLIDKHPSEVQYHTIIEFSQQALPS